MGNRKERRALRRWARSIVCCADTSRLKRRWRREARRHARVMDRSGYSEKAAIWRKRARNG